MTATRLNIRIFLKSLFLLALFSAGWLVPPSMAQTQLTKSARVVLNDDKTRIFFGNDVYVTQDAEKTLGAKVIFTRHQSNLRGDRQTSKLIDLGINSPHSILSFSVTNQSATEDWFLHFGRLLDGRQSTVKNLTVSNMQTGEVVKLTPINYNGSIGPAVKLRLEKSKTQFLVVSYEQEGGFANTIAPFFISESNYVQSLQFGDFLSSLANILFIFAVGFIVAFTISKRSFEALAILPYFLLATFLYFVMNTGFIAPVLSDAVMKNGLLGLIVAGGLLASRFFLGIKQQDITENIMFLGLAGLNVLVLGGYFFAQNTSGLFDDILIFAITILSLAAICAVSITQGQRGQAGAYFYCSGFFALFIGLLLSGLAAVNVVSSNVLFVNAFWLSLIPHAGFIGYALYIQDKLEASRRDLILAREKRASHSADRLQQSKENADQSRLLRVIERERELMSELREREIQRTDEMRKSKDQADEANRAKSAFLAVVSHEIRTPMTGILGMVRLLLDTQMNKQQHDYSQAILNSGDSMMALLNDILDFEKIESGNMDLEMIECDLTQLVQSVVTLMSGHATEKGISLAAQIDENFPLGLMGDPTRIRQILLNLVNNAIKFTDNGGVKIILKAQPVDTSKEENGQAGKTYQEIYFAVEDTGIGISEEGQSKLFAPFSQAEKSTARKYGGTGLGLAICRRLIEAMRGDIQVSSVEGEGTTFFFNLIMERTAQDAEDGDATPAQPVQQEAPIKPMWVLVVEDNEMNQKVIQGFLHKHNHEVTLTGSGEEALEVLQSKTFDVILCDIELTGMNGLDTTRAIRALPDPVQAETPVIALTGNVSKEDVQGFYAANMNGALAKPLDPEALKDVLQRVCDKNLEQPVILPKPLDGSIPNIAEEVPQVAQHQAVPEQQQQPPAEVEPVQAAEEASAPVTDEQPVQQPIAAKPGSIVQASSQRVTAKGSVTQIKKTPSVTQLAQQPNAPQQPVQPHPQEAPSPEPSETATEKPLETAKPITATKPTQTPAKAPETTASVKKKASSKKKPGDIKMNEDISEAPIHKFLAEVNVEETFDSFDLFDGEDDNEADDDAEPVNKDDVLNQVMVDNLKSSLGDKAFHDLLKGFFDKADELITELNGLQDGDDATSMQARGHELKGMAANFGFSEVAAIARIIEHSSKDGNVGEAVEAIKKLPDARQRALKAIAF